MNYEDYDSLPRKEASRYTRRDKRYTAAQKETMNSGQNKYWHSVAQSLARKAQAKKRALQRKAVQDQSESNS